MHCELGGHPTPKGVRSVLNVSEARGALITELLLCEAVRHSLSARTYLVAAGPTLGDSLHTHGFFNSATEHVGQQWRDQDELARREWSFS